jgi:hypothetical protein
MKGLKPILLAVVVVMISLPARAEEEVKVLRRVLSWSSEEGPAYKGFHQTRLSEARLDEQLQLLGRDDERLILSSSLSASSGRMVQVLTEDRTDWWVRLTIDMDVTGSNLHEFFQNAYAAEPGRQQLRLTTSDGFEMRTDAPLNGTAPVASLLLAELRRRNLADDVSRQVSPEVARAVVFLGSSFADVHAAVSPGLVGGRADFPLVDLLSAVLVESAGAIEPPPIPMRLEELQTDRVGPQDEWLEKPEPEVSGADAPR